MAKQRPGEARVYPDSQRPGCFIVQISLGHSRYQRRRAATAESAARVQAELEDRYREQLAPLAARKTLQAFVNEWWDRAIKPRDLAPKTKADYRDTIERYLLPRWGGYRLDEIVAPVVIDMFYVLCAEFSEAVAHRALTKLHMLLEAARRWRYLKYNAVADARVDLPEHEIADDIPLTAMEVQRLLAVVEKHRLCAAFHLMLTLGIRLGELLGLQWGDVNWEARTIEIRRQGQEVKGKLATRQTTKNHTPRLLPLPPALLERLRTLPQKGLFVFSTKQGKMLAPSVFHRTFRGGKTGLKKKDGSPRRTIGIRQKAKLPTHVTPHTFRHTVGTYLMELGVPEEIRAAILGHQRKGITQHYAHAQLPAMRVALERLEQTILKRAA